MLQDFNAKLTEKKQLTADVFEFKFEVEEDKQLDFEAGQYVLLKVPQEAGNIKLKHYSVNSPDFQKHSFDLLAKLVPNGIASEYLKKIAVGASVSFRGPAGLFLLKQTDRPKIFLATGTGIAPAHSIINSVLNSKSQAPNSKFVLFWGLPTMEDVYYADEFKTLASRFPNFKFCLFLSREQNMGQNGSFVSGRVNKGVDELFNGVANREKLPIKNFEFYICGDKNIVESLRQYVISLGADPQSITFEKFV